MLFEQLEIPLLCLLLSAPCRKKWFASSGYMQSGDSRSTVGVQSEYSRSYSRSTVRVRDLQAFWDICVEVLVAVGSSLGGSFSVGE